MEILKFPNPILLQKTEEVVVFGSELKTLLDAMWDTMSTHHGMGLAANQVGLIHRMFVMEGPGGQRYDLVNPYIVNKSNAPANQREGCLSAPGDFVIVPDRAQWVQVTYEDREGKSRVKVFHGIYAVCCQHEIEHLDGNAYLENKSIPKNIRKDLASKWGLKVK